MAKQEKTLTRHEREQLKTLANEIAHKQGRLLYRALHQLRGEPKPKPAKPRPIIIAPTIPGSDDPESLLDGLVGQPPGKTLLPAKQSSLTKGTDYI